MSRQTILEVAEKQNGIQEKPTNKTLYGQWYGNDGDLWCAMFVSWVYAQAGHPLEHINSKNGYASCQNGYEYWKEKGCIVKDPQPGDVVLYSFHGASRCNHTGIFVKWTDDSKTAFKAWEGNTVIKGNQCNGGEVMLRTRNRVLVKAFVTPTVLKDNNAAPSALYDGVLKQGEMGSDVVNLQKYLIELKYKLTASGIFDETTKTAVEQFQKDKALEVTGEATEDLMAMLHELAKPEDVPDDHFTLDTYLKRGTAGPDVKELQKALNTHGAKPHIDEDGVFGKGTLAAVKAFQLAKSLDADGIAGPNTLTALGLDL